MERKPFNYTQAIKIAADFQHLINKPMGKNGEGVKIHHVVISPFDDENIKVFIKNLWETDDVNKALEDYPKLFFDVILLSDLREEIRPHRRIRDYAKEYELDYSFPTEYF